MVRLVRQVADDPKKALQHRAARLTACRPWLEQRRVLEHDEHPSETSRRHVKAAFRPPEEPLEAADDGKAEL